MTLNLTREQIEDCIEYLVGYLDQIDPDPDLEEGGDKEPNLADSSTDLEGDFSDDEPWLSAGAFKWDTSGSNDDRELDRSDDEPYLSAGAAGWFSGGDTNDLEQQAGDAPGLIYGGNEAVMALAPYKAFV